MEFSPIRNEDVLHEEVALLESQIIAILKQAEACTPVPELCREQGMSLTLFYKWRSRFGGMDAR